MSVIYPLMTLERLPEMMDSKEVREMVAFLLCTTVRSKDFHCLSRLEQVTVVDFCLSVQNILLEAYKEENE